MSSFLTFISKFGLCISEFGCHNLDSFLHCNNIAKDTIHCHAESVLLMQ